MCDSEKFFDALDEFPLPDCENDAESEESIEFSEISQLEFVEVGPSQIDEAKNLAKNSSSTGLRRRSSFRSSRQGSSFKDAKDSGGNSLATSEIGQVFESSNHRERRKKILSALKDRENVFERSDSDRFRLGSDGIDNSNEKSHQDSTVTSAKEEHVDMPGTVNSLRGDIDESSSDFLVFLAGLVIKALGLQISLFISLFTFPFWFLYGSLMFLMDPFRVSRRARGYMIAKLLKILDVFCRKVTPFIYEWLKGQKSFGKMALRLGCGLFWSIYVCMMLLGILVSAFVFGGFMMRYIVEEPIQMTETQSFDYTKPSPVAFVPILSCPSVSCGLNCKENVEFGQCVGVRGIPPNHRLQVTVKLTLPESEYNRKLGVFQVRVDFLSINGKVTASSSYPCMLRYKSLPVLLLGTFLKSIPLLAGYSSESQTVTLKMRGFTEGKEPIACLRVFLEQRAEYRPSAGIPEIYTANVVLESELPLFKRIIWYWKNTIFIWFSMMSFVMELMVALVCCRPIIIPRGRPRNEFANRNSIQNTIAQGRSS